MNIRSPMFWLLTALSSVQCRFRTLSRLTFRTLCTFKTKWKFSKQFRSIMRLWALALCINRLGNGHLMTECCSVHQYLDAWFFHNLCTSFMWPAFLCNTWNASVRLPQVSLCSFVLQQCVYEEQHYSKALQISKDSSIRVSCFGVIANHDRSFEVQFHSQPTIVHFRMQTSKIKKIVLQNWS